MDEVKKSQERERERERRILVVDDSVINQKLLSRFLCKFSISVDLANNGKEAVEKVKVARYDLIFMDINMPVMDGITATRLIREQPNHYKEHLPIIALTSNGSSSDIVKSLDAGLNEHVVKPLRLKRLKVILQAYSLLD